MRTSLLHALLAALLFLIDPRSSGAVGIDLVQSVRLPLDLARDTASTALHTCAQRGASVSVSLVDSQGQLQVFLQGDSAAPHTAELSRHKAYTALSLAALQGFHTTGELASAMRQTKAPIGMLPLPADSLDGVTPVAGGVVLRQGGDQLLGGLGVSGARQGELDEQCALVAESWLAGQLDG